MVMLNETDDMDVLVGEDLEEAEADHAAAFNADWLLDLIEAGCVFVGEVN
ncbi:MAG: hypothetical protein ACXAC5_02855 [Promethearchaeota archaeon]|jgi:hypothetical protein